MSIFFLQKIVQDAFPAVPRALFTTLVYVSAVGPQAIYQTAVSAFNAALLA